MHAVLVNYICRIKSPRTKKLSNQTLTAIEATITMAILFSSSFLSVLILPMSTLFIISTISITASNIPPKRLVTKLISRNSIRSPLYDSDASNRASMDMEISIARFAFLQAKMSYERSSTFSPSDYRLNILPSASRTTFFINITVGTPPIPQLAMMDTGSNFLWIQCFPCKNCGKHYGPILFNPSSSSTYRPLYCNSDSFCKSIGAPNSLCNDFYSCNYTMVYYSGVISKGIVSSETVTFQASDESTIIVQNVIFGCGHEINRALLESDYRTSGVFGLGAESPLLLRFGSKFSYCIGDLDDSYYEHNQLIVGEGARFEGYITPIEVVNGNYYMILEGISVGANKLDIDPSIFTRVETVGLSGVTIDTGTAITWLADDGFYTLKNEVQRVIFGLLTQAEYYPWKLCYEGRVESYQLARFPLVTFHFADGADLKLDKWSLFRQIRPDIFCMAIMPSSYNGKQRHNLSLIGIYAQQYYNMAYDLIGKTLSFKKIDCDELDDSW